MARYLGTRERPPHAASRNIGWGKRRGAETQRGKRRRRPEVEEPVAVRSQSPIQARCISAVKPIAKMPKA